MQGGRTVEILQANRHTQVSDFFYRFPPAIWFADGSSLEGNRYVELRNTPPAYDATKIQTLDWAGVDLRKESQGKEKDPTSIQARMIRELSGGGYTIIFDDDSRGEAADIVAVRIVGEPAEPSCLEVEF